jgi:hypothetical protein
MSLGLLASKQQTGDIRTTSLNSTEANIMTPGPVSKTQAQHVDPQPSSFFAETDSLGADETIDPQQLTHDLTAIFDTVQQPYRWSDGGATVPDNIESHRHAFSWAGSRDFLGLV